MSECTCRHVLGEPDHAAEQVAANLAAGHDWLTAYRAVFAPWLLPESGDAANGGADHHSNAAEWDDPARHRALMEQSAQGVLL